jgi:hypothetical protein
MRSVASAVAAVLLIVAGCAEQESDADVTRMYAESWRNCVDRALDQVAPKATRQEQVAEMGSQCDGVRQEYFGKVPNHDDADLVAIWDEVAFP